MKAVDYLYNGVSVQVERVSKQGRYQIHFEGKLMWVDADQITEVSKESAPAPTTLTGRAATKQSIQNALIANKEDLIAKPVEYVCEYLKSLNLPHSIPTVKAYAKDLEIPLLASKSTQISDHIELHKERYKRMKLTLVANELSEALGFKVFASSISHRL